MTPADTDLLVALSPPQSASEYAHSSPLCCQRNQHLALGFPTRYRPILLTRSTSGMVGLAIAQHTCIRCKLEIWSILRQVTDSCSECSVPHDVTNCECLPVIVIIICHLRSVAVVSVVHVVPGSVWIRPCARCCSPLPSSFLSTALRSGSPAPTQDLSVFP